LPTSSSRRKLADFSVGKRQHSQVEMKEIPVRHTKKIFTRRVVQDWSRLSREAVKSPSFNISKIQLDKFLSSLI